MKIKVIILNVSTTFSDIILQENIKHILMRLLLIIQLY